MDPSQLRKAFKAFLNTKSPMGLAPVLLAGLGFLALQSYYYGPARLTQLM